MNQRQLKDLIKHILLEVNEMIVNKNKKPDAFGFVNVEEKINTDGTYSDDMEDAPKQLKKIDIDEMASCSAAGGQEGGTIRVPAWGTKNKDGSPGARKAMKNLGWKETKSISK